MGCTRPIGATRLLSVSLAIAMLFALQACGGGKKTSTLCTTSDDCPAGQICLNGACTTNTQTGDTATGDQTDDTGNTDDTTTGEDQTTTDTGGEKTCSQEGQIACNSDKSGYQKCLSGQWIEFNCPPTSCEGIPGIPDTGLKPGLCEDNVGCLLTTCEPCAGNTVVDTVTGGCFAGCNDESSTPQDNRCAPGYKCNAGTCEKSDVKKTDGDTCTAGTECESGNCVRTLVDGSPDSNRKVCCSEACSGTCQYCNEVGTCVTQESGRPSPEDCTAQDPSTCGLTGNCDDTGGCEKWADDTVCAPSKCESDTEYGPSVCKAGKCEPPTGSPCGDVADCRGAVCGAKDCDVNSDCADLAGGSDAWFCQTDLAAPQGKGFCAKRRDNLALCADVNGSQITYAVKNVGDGIDTACKSGSTCAVDAITSGKVSYMCVPTNSCNFRGNKVAPDGVVACNGDDYSITCKSGTWSDKTNCPGRGPCEAVDGEPNTGFREGPKCVMDKGCSQACPTCNGFLADANGCKDKCGADTDCAKGYYCSSDSICTLKKGNGEECKGANECTNGNCVESEKEGVRICCGEACDGKCNFCAEQKDGSWACSFRDKGYADPQCKVSSDPTCGQGVCDGAGTCSIPKDTKCGSNSTCTSGDPSKLAEEVCDGAGKCVLTQTKDCPTGKCADAKTCEKACTKHSDCTAKDPNTFCSENGLCLGKLANGQNCSDVGVATDNRNGVCSSGTCRLDNLALYDNVGNQTNFSGQYYCTTSTQCPDGVADKAPTATLRDKDYLMCDGKYNGTKSGVGMWVCNGSTWVLQGSYCNVTALRPSPSYPPSGTQVGSYWTGYKDTTCSNGLTTSITNCKVDTAHDCGGYLHQADASVACFDFSCTSYKKCGTPPCLPIPYDNDLKCQSPIFGCEGGKCKIFGLTNGESYKNYTCCKGSDCQSGSCLKGLYLADKTKAVCQATANSHCKSTQSRGCDGRCYNSGATLPICNTLCVKGTCPTDYYCNGLGQCVSEYNGGFVCKGGVIGF